MARYDSLIFDMDGTLWDAVDSYPVIWNTVFGNAGVKRIVTREDLVREMGRPLTDILNNLLPEADKDRVDFQKMHAEIHEKEATLMPILGGKLYPGVVDGIKKLSEKYKLLMVSNCGAWGLKNFLIYSGLEPYFIDTLTNGETRLEKADNIRIVCERNGLKAPAYVGDIQKDSDAAHKAGIDMIYVSYGFGECNDAEISVDSFPELVDILMEK